MVEEEKHGETLNDDLVNKIMNELDETKIQTDPVFEQEDVKPIINDDSYDAEEIAKSKKMKKGSKKRKKPLIHKIRMNYNIVSLCIVFLKYLYLQHPLFRITMKK